MRRSVLLVVAIALLTCMLACGSSSGTETCSDSSVATWFDQSAEIGNALDQYSTASAKSAYEKQQQVVAPECLATAQKLSVDFYYYVWQSDEARDGGDAQFTRSYADKAIEAQDQLMIEMDRLAAKYGWPK
jgi:hypothetical protein